MKPEHKIELKRIIDKFNSIKTTQYDLSEVLTDEMELYIIDSSVDICAVPPPFMRYCLDNNLHFYFKHDPITYKVVMHIF